ncbi:MAG: hypothetical protein ACYCQK_01725 [Acidiferrobacteraceae bacterium]
MMRLAHQLQIERKLARQSLVHHARREAQLERLLAQAVALAKPKCKCHACRMLRTLLAELGEG